MKLKSLTNKKGSIFDMPIMIIAVFIFVVASGIVTFIYFNVGDELEKLPTSTAQEEMEHTYYITEAAILILPSAAAFLMIGFIVSIIVGVVMVRSHPILILLYLIFIIPIFILVSVAISNFYQAFATSAEFGTTFLSFGAINFMFVNLPVVVGVTGIVGLLIMVINWRLKTV